MRALVGLVLAVFVIACGSGASGAPAAFDCSWTKPRNVTPPPLPVTLSDQNESVTRNGTPLLVHFNETLAVRLPMDGTTASAIRRGWEVTGTAAGKPLTFAVKVDER